MATPPQPKPAIVGRTITGIRQLTDKECQQIWDLDVRHATDHSIR